MCLTSLQEETNMTSALLMNKKILFIQVLSNMHHLWSILWYRFQSQSISGNQSNTKSFYLLLDLMTFFDQYHGRDLDRALSVSSSLDGSIVLGICEIDNGNFMSYTKFHSWRNKVVFWVKEKKESVYWDISIRMKGQGQGYWRHYP